MNSNKVDSDHHLWSSLRVQRPAEKKKGSGRMSSVTRHQVGDGAVLAEMMEVCCFDVQAE